MQRSAEYKAGARAERGAIRRMVRKRMAKATEQGKEWLVQIIQDMRWRGRLSHSRKGGVGRK